MATDTAGMGSYAMATDLDLLKRYAADGDGLAFTQLARRHRDMVYRTCYRVLGNNADAEDAAQECFVALARSAGRVSASVAGWLHRVAARSAKTLKERDQVARERERAAAEFALAPDEDAAWEEISPYVDQAIDRLPDRLRIPLVLYYLDGRNQSTVAEELGVDQSTVSYRLGKAVERVRSHLRKGGVLAGAATLTTFLTTETSHAAPASLATELGKLAVSGVGSGGTTAASGGAGLASVWAALGMWQVQVGVVAAVAVVGGVAAYSYAGKHRPSSGAVSAASVVAPVVAAPAEAIGPVQAAAATEDPEEAEASPPLAEDATERSVALTVEADDGWHGERPDGASPALATRSRPLGAAGDRDDRHRTGAAEARAEPAAGIAPPSAVATERPRLIDGRTPPGPDPPVRVAQATDAPPPAAPEIDRTDPAAIAKAYVEACRMGDAQTALSLVHPDDPLRRTLENMVHDMGEQAMSAGTDFTRLLTEFAFVPIAVGFEAGEPVQQGDPDADTVILVKRSWNVDQKLIMEQAADGTWSIRAVPSITATTGAESSFLVAEAAEGRGPSSMGVGESEGRLTRLARAFSQYAAEHDGLLPPADSWCDAIQLYALDPALFECPAFPDQEYGYAMNVLADQARMPADWQERRDLILLFEWRGAERNASAMSDGLDGMESGWPDGTIVVADATGAARRIPAGLTLAGLTGAEERRDTCWRSIDALTKATLAFARDHGGLLPGASTWHDDIAAYLLDEIGVEDPFRCPAAPELDFAYAINSKVAGMNAAEVGDLHGTVLFFESDLNVPNATGDPDTDAPPEGRHVINGYGRLQNQASLLSGYPTYLQPPAPQGP